MANPHKGLTEMQKIFCAEYIACGNAYESALKAGYSDKYAKAKSGSLLKNPKIKAYINELMDERTDALTGAIASVDEILCYLSDVMRGKTGAKPSERLRACELLGKNYALWTEKNVQTEIKQVIFTNDMLPPDDEDIDFLPMEATQFIEGEDMEVIDDEQTD